MSSRKSMRTLEDLVATGLERQDRAAATRLHRRRSAHSTSAPVDEIVVELADGGQVELMAKKLGAGALLGPSRKAKPAFAANATREVAVYTHLADEVGPPRCWGVVDEPDGPLLVLERVPGLALRYVGELHLWQEAAAWLAGFHARWPSSASHRLPAPLLDHLLRYDAAHHERLLRRAVASADARGHPLPALVVEQHRHAAHVLDEQPPCLVHGELYASNVIVDVAVRPPRIAILDWEMAGTGPPLLDLAALVSGSWTAHDRQAIVEAYRLASPRPLGPVVFDRLLVAAELLVSTQWLGWADRWSPPPELATDWAATALAKACALEAGGPPRARPRRPLDELRRSGDRRLIVNADDLGLSDGVNRGIFEAHEHGIVTSASLMVRGAAAVGAAAGAAARPGLALGMHVDLGEWRYGTEGWEVAYQLVDCSDTMAVEAEIAEQLAIFRALVGRDPTHLDSHQHVHREPAVEAVMAELAEHLAVPLRGAGTVTHCGGFYGQLSTGEPHPDAITVDNLVRLIEATAPGITEIACHPGYIDATATVYAAERAQELRVLCDPRVARAVAEADVHLVSFADLSPR